MQTDIQNNEPVQHKAKGQSLLNTIKSGLLALIRLEYFPIALLLILYVVVNSCLTFLSEYKNYIFSDMDAYFNHAIQIYNNQEKVIGNWVGFSPLYSRILAEFYAVLKLFNVQQYFLVYILIQNIALSAISGIALYAIAYKFSKKRWLGIVLTGLYLFSYAHLYFNAFVLSEPFVVPLIIITTSLLFFWHNNAYKVFFLGLLLALCVGVRPANGLLGLPFAMYIWLNGFSFKTPIKEWIKRLWPSTLRAGIFSLAFFATLVVIVAENNRISDGRMKNLTSNSGFNFLIGQSQAHRIFSSWDGLTFVFSASSVAHHPEKGSLRTKIPIYDSEAFYEEGWKILDKYPHLWVEHFAKYKYLFFDNLFPGVGNHLWFPLMEVFRYVLFYMLLLCGLTYITFKKNDIPRSVLYFFYAAFILPAASLYMYTATHKYFFNFSYTVYILFSFGLFSTIKHWHEYKRLVAYYLSILVLGTVGFWSYIYYSRAFIEQNLIAVISESNPPIRNLYSPRDDIKRSQTLFLDEAVFYEHDQLQHSTLNLLDFTTNYFMDIETNMTLLEDGTYTFTIFGDDGYRLLIDGKSIIYSHGPKGMADGEKKRTVKLTKGEHKLQIKMYQTHWASGLAAYYRREESHPKHEDIIWEPMGGRGFAIGRDDGFTLFEAPDEISK